MQANPSEAQRRNGNKWSPLMRCILCEKDIEKYSPEFNHLKIDDSHSADFCQDCIDKLLKWQQKLFAKMFPTAALKKRFADR
jgi:hypothetical protein